MSRAMPITIQMKRGIGHQRMQRRLKGIRNSRGSSGTSTNAGDSSASCHLQCPSRDLTTSEGVNRLCLPLPHVTLLSNTSNSSRRVDLPCPAALHPLPPSPRQMASPDRGRRPLFPVHGERQSGLLRPYRPFPTRRGRARRPSLRPSPSLQLPLLQHSLPPLFRLRRLPPHPYIRLRQSIFHRGLRLRRGSHIQPTAISMAPALPLLLQCPQMPHSKEEVASSMTCLA